MEKLIEELTYEEAYEELGQIVASLEEGQQTLNESLALFERGQQLLKHCSSLLEQAHLKVKQLIGEEMEDFEEES